MNQIQRIETRYFRVPLRDCLVDALHGTHTHFELITATVTMEDGTEGTDIPIPAASAVPLLPR